MDLLILPKAINISKCNSLKQTLKQLEILNYDKNALAVRLLSIYNIGSCSIIILKNEIILENLSYNDSEDHIYRFRA